MTGLIRTAFLLDGGNVAAELENGRVTNNYLRGANLIRWTSGMGTGYYLYNAHGDVVNLTNPAGASYRTYSYDAFGKQKNPDNFDFNPFRYCGEYYDKESGNYYLRSRYYNPANGRFTQPDSHWNNANRIYGDNPQKINERQDALGTTLYSYRPQISAIMQSGNLYAYALNNPISYSDPTGGFVVTTAMLITAGCILVFGTAGGIIGGKIADRNGVTGWKRTLCVAGGTLAGSLGGAALASAAVPATTRAGAGAAAGATATAGAAAAESSTIVQATGQLHHVLSNPIMRALNNHPTLSGLFDRASSVVRALTPEAHRGYQAWHRAIDNAMVDWITSPQNADATAAQFWAKLYELYNTPDMIERFGNGVLNYISEMMK